jgi:hypothetical protein
MEGGGHLVRDVEGIRWDSRAVISVETWPAVEACAGSDLIKIDAEGAEAAILEAARPVIAERKPTLMIEVLPTALQLAEVVRDLARSFDYGIYIVPGWGSDKVHREAVESFIATMLLRLNSKDVVLSRHIIA